ncbi:THAP domain-containing protein 6-like [Aricia agestis]|uniref:THAP domain-containing protein 6-like n=1 Tax=Aricia agestis TaxID=91739 RepID=UPI001C205AA1|nr:THAP domain-containing protein 6-like [Aricia agestis]
MPSCAVPTCRNAVGRIKKQDGITFHVFPADEIIRAKWTKIIRLARLDEIWNPSKSSVICSKHFEDDCFYDTKCGFKKLRKGSFPNKHMAIISEEDEILMDTSISGPLADKDHMAMVTAESGAHIGALSAGPAIQMNVCIVTIYAYLI